MGRTMLDRGTKDDRLESLSHETSPLPNRRVPTAAPGGGEPTSLSAIPQTGWTVNTC